MSLRKKATHGFLWSGVDTFGVRIFQFVSGVILARLLLPSDFGLVAMLSVFIAVSQAFIDSGMGSGLVQKQNRTEVDYSTVFVFNLGVSVLIYGLLFLAAPLIARFYEQPQLTLLTRVLTLNFLISALAIVQRTRLTIALDFKSLAKASIASTLLGGIVGIAMAYTGFGVWALVGQTLVGSATAVFVFWLISKWTPSFLFSKKSFNNLFGYGSRLLAVDIYAKVLQELYSVIIGKAYSSSELGFFSRTKSISLLAAGSISQVINKVSFPILSSLQSEPERKILATRRMIKMSAFIIMPIMALIAILAEPIVILLLTEKWQAVIPLLRWMVFVRIFYPASTICLNLLKADGRSGSYLFIELIKFPVIIGILLVTVRHGLTIMIIGQVFSALISYFINAFLMGKRYNYGFISQITDMLPMMLLSLLMAIVTWLTIMPMESLLGKLLIGGIVGVFSYALMAYIAKMKEFEELALVVTQITKKIKW